MDNLLNMLTNLKVVGENNDDIKKFTSNPIISGLLNSPQVKEVTENPMVQTIMTMFNNLNSLNEPEEKKEVEKKEKETDFKKIIAELLTDNEVKKEPDEFEWDFSDNMPKQCPFTFVNDFFNVLMTSRSVTALSNYFNLESQYIKTNYDGEVLWSISGRKKITDYFSEFWFPSHDSDNTIINSFAVNLVNDNDTKVYEIKYNIKQPILDTGCMKWRMANITARDIISISPNDGKWYIDTYNTRVLNMKMDITIRNY